MTRRAAKTQPVPPHHAGGDMTFIETLSKHIAAGASALWVSTHEESRVLRDVYESDLVGSRHVYKWTVTAGLVNMKTNEVVFKPGLMDPASSLEETFLHDKATAKPRLVLLCDPHDFLKSVLIRAWKDCIEAKNGVFIVISPKSDIPLELQHLVVTLPFDLPLKDRLVAAVKRNKSIQNLPGTAVDDIAEAALGLTEHEAQYAASYALQVHGISNPAAVAKEVWDLKSRLSAASGLLTTSKPSVDFSDIGGMYALKKWLEDRRYCFTEEGTKAGRPPIRGILLIGPPGTGKTLLGRAIAKWLNRRFVEWDLAKLFGPFVGETERATDMLIKLTEVHAPCVVYADEFAHQMSGFESSGYTDSGVVSRVVGRLMTWTQDKADNILFIGSTNEPWRFPPHFARPPRINVVWHIDFPRADALTEILEYQLKKYGQSSTGLDLGQVARQMAESKFSGAEVEQVVIEALQGLGQKGKLTTDYLKRTSMEVIPIAETMWENIERIQTWAKGRARSAA